MPDEQEDDRGVRTGRGEAGRRQKLSKIFQTKPKKILDNSKQIVIINLKFSLLN
jgi:hypothetical protein